MNESSTRPIFERAGEAAAATAAAIKAFMQMLPSAEQLSVGTTALAMLLLSDSAHALIDASNAIGDLLPLDVDPAAALAPQPAPQRKQGGRRLSPLLRQCMCTHPFSDHDDANAGGGSCAMCTCEMFEEPITRADLATTPHRHIFGADGKCTKCGKTKSANGRKPAGAVAAEAPPVDTRTMRLPIPPLGDVAADRFSDGGQGSSMVRR